MRGRRSCKRKFLTLAAKAVTRKKADEIADVVAGLDALSDASQLARLLAGRD